MTFSYSGWKTYKTCQRKWLFISAIKAPNTKDEFRKKVGILSNIQSLDAWRGEIVDFTISNFIIRGLNRDIIYTLEDAIAYAKKICKKRYEFAKAKRYWDKDVVKYKMPEDYSAIFDFEFGTEPTSKDFWRVWEDIEKALTNLFAFEELTEILENPDNKLIPQRNLYLDINDYKVKGIPDLIVLNKEYPPHIIDWKVHFSGNKTYNEQLMIYALALNRSKPHNDYTGEHIDFDILNYRLSEYQLLINEHREYPITEEYLKETESFLIDGTYQLDLAGGTESFKNLKAEDFEYAANPQNCITCPFHKICNHVN